MKKLICSYEATIEEMEREAESSRGRSFEVSSKAEKQNYDARISSLMRKLEHAQEHLDHEKADNKKLKARLREVEKRKEEEAVSRSITESFHEEDSELLEQIVVELENEKHKNQQLQFEVNELRKHQALGFSKNRSQRSIRQSFEESFNEDLPLNAQNGEHLLTQIQIYKSEYYKALDSNRMLQAEIYQLEEELRSSSHCSTHINAISNLTRKVSDYEEVVIPKLKAEIRKYRDELNSKARHRSYSQFENVQESPNFIRREELSPVLVKTSNEKDFDFEHQLSLSPDRHAITFSPEKDSAREVSLK